MKNKYIVKIAAVAFTFLTGFANAQDTPFLQFGGKPAQDTAASKKMSFWNKLTKTPWVIQVGPCVVDDDDAALKDFVYRSDKNFYPVHASAEKRLKYLKGKVGIQAALSSETLSPHTFWSTDINLKYNFLTAGIRDKKIFDPYAVLGGGHTYRDFPLEGRRGSGKDNSMNANVGAGANIWLFENAGIYFQGVAKFVLLQKKYDGSNYLQYSVGVVFKIGSDAAVPKIVEQPVSNYKRSKEAEEAAEYLRQILNK